MTMGGGVAVEESSSINTNKQESGGTMKTLLEPADESIIEDLAGGERSSSDIDVEARPSPPKKVDEEEKTIYDNNQKKNFEGGEQHDYNGMMMIRNKSTHQPKRMCFRRLMLYGKIEQLGFFVAIVSYLLFFLLVINVSLSLKNVLDDYSFADPLLVIHAVFLAGWMSILGCCWTYLLPALSGFRLYFAVTGYKGLIAIIFHIVVFLLGVFGYCDDCNEGYDYYEKIDISFICIYLLLVGLHIFLMRSSEPPLLQLRDLYKFKNSWDDDKPIEEPISRDEIEMLLRRAIMDLDLQATINAKDVELCCITMGHAEGSIDWAYILESLSNHVGFLPRCTSSKKNNKLTPGQYMQLAKELHCLIGRFVLGERFDEKSNATRLTPWSSFEILTSIISKWFAAPWELMFTLVGVIAISTVVPLQALFMGKIVDYATSAAAAITDDQGEDYTTKAAYALLGWSVAILANGPINLFVVYAQSRLNSKAVAIIRDRMYQNVIKGGTKFADHMGEGTIMDTFSSQLGKLEIIMLNATFTVMKSGLELLTGIFFAFRVNPVIAVLFACLLPVMYSIDGLAKRASKLSKQAASKEAEVATKFNSIVNSLPVIETCNSESWISDGFRPAKDELYNARKDSIFVSSSLQTYYISCGAFYSACVVIPWGLALLDGFLTAGQFVTVVDLCRGMVLPLERLGGFMRNASNYSGAMQRVDDLVSSGEEEEKRKEVARSSGDQKDLNPLADHVEVNGVTYRYPGSDVDVLKGVNIDLFKGKYITLFGTSGSGKSTLMDILMRKRPCGSGSVKWDDHDIDEATVGSFRKEVAVMFQKTMILEPGTIRDNITFGTPVHNQDQIELAAKMAEIDDVIRSLPDGYDTVLGDGTTGMSGGQLQRICLARALYRKPSVLLLDEATSALDPISKAAIVNTFVKLCHEGGLTIFSISHHPDTAIDADKIVVLNKGVVAEEGTYDDLANIDGGIFRAMIEAADKKDEDEKE